MTGGAIKNARSVGFIFDGNAARETSLTDITGINMQGQLTGNFLDPDSSIHGVTVLGDIVTALGSLGGQRSNARAINNAGQVVGNAEVLGGAAHAFIYSAGLMSDLGTLGGGYSFANDINDEGEVVGSSTTLGERSAHAFAYSNGRMTDLGALRTGGASNAYGINNRGQITGDAIAFGSTWSHAFLYENGMMHDLGTLGGAYSWGMDISDAGWIVGTSADSSGNMRGFLYADGAMHDLTSLLADSSGLTVRYATAINSSHQIAAQACRDDGHCDAVRLDLVESSPIPEPKSALLFTLGLGLLCRARRAKRSR
jgi:probable HAF family extracellular repeat protein